MINEINNIKDATESAHAQIINMHNLDFEQLKAYFIAFAANIERELQAIEKTKYFLIVEEDDEYRVKGQYMEPHGFLGILTVTVDKLKNDITNKLTHEPRH